jgi:dihydroflavonol-4-reductase
VTALVTGGTGFVGAHVVRALLERGAGGPVRCLVRPASDRSNLEGLDVELAPGDLRDPESLAAACRGCEEVYHCAADYRLFARDPSGIHASNTGGTRNLLAAARSAGVRRIVYTSSVAALGLEPGGEPADETTPVDPAKIVGHYKRSKYDAERVAEQAAADGAPVVIVNPSTPVGELDVKPTPTGRIIVDFLSGRMPAWVDTGLNVVDVRDVAKGHLLAAERGRVGEKYILGNRNLTLRELLQLLAEITGRRAPRLRLPHWLPIAVAAVDTGRARCFGGEPRVPLESARMARKKMFFDAGKAVRELGLPQSPVEEALRRAVEWFEGRTR